MSLPFSDATKRLDAPGEDLWAVHTEALERYSKGEDVLVLSVGDPDFPTPAYISDHVISQIRNNRTHYSPAAGEPILREAIANLESRLGPGQFSADEVVVFPGGTAALFCTLSCLVNPGDEILVSDPMYVGYQGLFDALGLKVVTVPLVAPEFELKMADVLVRLSPKTKLVLVNTPGNPCGNVISGDILKELAAACLKRDIWLVCDEMYSLFTFETPHVSLLRVVDDRSNIVVIDGLSKSHAMTGWRIGWAIGSQPVVDALIRFSGAAFFGVNQFVQDGAACALDRDAPDVERMRLEYLKRRDYAASRLDPLNQLDYFLPQAGMFIMIDASPAGMDGQQFARRLLDETGVSTIPGGGFGQSTANYVRLSLTKEVDVLAGAFDRIERMLGA